MTGMTTAPLDAATGRVWDAIVIGTGMGGGSAGRALAEAGLSVLFVEKGPAGYRAEQNPLLSESPDPVARQMRGCWPAPMAARIDGMESEFLRRLAAEWADHRFSTPRRWNGQSRMIWMICRGVRIRWAAGRCAMRRWHRGCRGRKRCSM